MPVLEPCWRWAGSWVRGCPPKRRRELKGVMCAGGTFGSGQSCGTKGTLVQAVEAEGGRAFPASLPLSSCCSQRSRSSARTAPRRPAPKGPLRQGSGALGSKALRSSRPAAGPALLCRRLLAAAERGAAEPLGSWPGARGTRSSCRAAPGRAAGRAWLSPQTPLPF